jgi:hypothetical protein
MYLIAVSEPADIQKRQSKSRSPKAIKGIESSATAIKSASASKQKTDMELPWSLQITQDLRVNMRQGTPHISSRYTHLIKVHTSHSGVNNLQPTHPGFKLVSPSHVYKVCDQPHPALVNSIIHHASTFFCAINLPEKYCDYFLKETKSCTKGSLILVPNERINQPLKHSLKYDLRNLQSAKVIYYV